MKLVRCPSCRTVNRVDRNARCAGCDRSLEGVVARERPMPAVLREAQRDGMSVWIVLAVLTLFSIISMTTMIRSLDKEDFGTALFTTAGSLGLVGTILWLPMRKRIHASKRYAAERAGLYIISFVAAAIGAGILLFLTCATFAR